MLYLKKKEKKKREAVQVQYTSVQKDSEGPVCENLQSVRESKVIEKAITVRDEKRLKK